MKGEGVGLSVDVTVVRGDFSVRAAFRAEAGETVALLGPNGSGKSTLVSAIAGLRPPVEGRIELDEAVLDGDGSHLAPEQRPIGVVFQDLLLFPHLSAIENVAFPLRARGAPKAEAHGRAESSCAPRRGSPRRGAPPRPVGGEAQRVALARAPIAEPHFCCSTSRCPRWTWARVHASAT